MIHEGQVEALSRRTEEKESVKMIFALHFSGFANDMHNTMTELESRNHHIFYFISRKKNFLGG